MTPRDHKFVEGLDGASCMRCGRPLDDVVHYGWMTLEQEEQLGKKRIAEIVKVYGCVPSTWKL